MPIDTIQIEIALTQFYTTKNDFERQKLHQWLTSIQNSQEVWAIAPLLLAPEKDVSVQFFSANCLYLKVSKSFDECPPEELDFLRGFLLDQLGLGSDQHSKTILSQRPLMVVSRLCVVLAVYAVQTMPDIWPDPVVDLISACQRSHAVIVLTVLAALPEEYRKLPVGLQRRASIRAHLRKQVENVANFVGQFLTADTCVGPTLEACALCIENWLEFESDLSDWEPIVFACLSKLNSTADDSILNSVSKLFIQLVSNSALIQLDKFLLRLFAYASEVIFPLFQKATQDHSCADECYTLGRMITTLSDNHSKCLVKHLRKDQSINSCLDAMLQISAMPGQYPIDEAVSELSIAFWLGLQDEFFAFNQSEQDKNERLVILRPVYSELLQKILSKSRFPTDTKYAEFSAEEKELHASYRRDQCDVFAACFKILQSDSFFTIMTQFAQTDRSWQTIEIVLFALECVGDYVSTDNEYVFDVIGSTVPVLQLNVNTVSILANTLLRMVSKLSFFIVERKLLGSVLPPILSMLARPDTSMPASHALKDLVWDRDNGVIPFATSILETIEVTLKQNLVCKADRSRLTECIGYILSVLPEQTVFDHLNRMLAPKIAALQQTTATSPIENILETLDFLAILVGCLNMKPKDSNAKVTDLPPESEPVFVVIKQFSENGLFESLYQSTNQDSQVAEKICDIHRRAVVVLMIHAAHLLPRLSAIITTFYTYQVGSLKLPHLSALSLAKQMFIIFAMESNYRPQVAIVFNEILEVTLRVCTTRIDDSLDLIELHLLTCYQTARKSADFLLNFCRLDLLMQLAFMGMQRSESNILKHASQFLCELLKHNDNDKVITLVEQSAVELSVTVLDKLKVEPLSSSVEYSADVLFSIVKFYPQLTMVIQSYLPKHDFISLILRENSNKRKFRELCRQLNLQCRRNNMQFL